MGSGTICYCKNDSNYFDANNNVDYDSKKLSICNEYNSTSTLNKKTRNELKYLFKKKSPDLFLIKQNAAATRITRFIFKIASHNYYKKIEAKKTSILFSSISVRPNSSRMNPTKNTHNESFLYGSKDKNECLFGIRLSTGKVKYRGDYKDNKEDGLIRFKRDGNIYEGEISNEGACGYGKYEKYTKVMYEGYWKNDSQEGIGIKNWPDGSFYQGEYMKSMKQGIGLYQWDNGCVYEGEWANNALNGYGVFTFANKNKFIGQWKDNAKEGIGIYIGNDCFFEGYYTKDKKNGFGVYYNKDLQEAFIGFWENDEKKGFGKLYKKDKEIYGIWGGGYKTEYSVDNLKKELNNLGKEKYYVFFKWTLKEIHYHFITLIAFFNE